MGWSEQYWEDVKGELWHPAAEPESANGEEAVTPADGALLGGSEDSQGVRLPPSAGAVQPLE